MPDFKDSYARVARLIDEKYNVKVSLCDVIDPNTGDFDGTQIKIDNALDLETAFFVLLHLFGHTVQWNVSEKSRAVGQDQSPSRTPEHLGIVFDYEKNATRYGLALMHEAGILGLERWVSDSWHADWKYLERLYTTGEKLDYKTLIRPGEGELLTPLEIPAFVPRQWGSRWSF